MKNVQCPECGRPMIGYEGCLKCPICGYTDCEEGPPTENEVEEELSESEELEVK